MCMSHPINKAIKKGFINLERTQFKFMRINDNSEKSSSLSVSILNFFFKKCYLYKKIFTKYIIQTYPIDYKF